MGENFLTDKENFSPSAPKKNRGRPKLTEEKKAAVKAKREAGKTKKFSVGEEPNRRIKN